ncbi:MAG: hypothetical protein ACRYGP_03425 [Janthinobacterium lividum]
MAFQVGTYAADIACVRQDWHRRGLGKILLEASIARAYRDDFNVLMGECSPVTSLPFWLAQGFDRYGDIGEWQPVLVRRVLPRRHELPAGRPLVDVVVGFYPEAVTYGRLAHMLAPIAEHRLRGGLLADGAIQLERRVIGLTDDEPDRKDLAVRIEVDGVERCFGKAKHAGAVAAGVRRGRDYASFHMDRLEPPVI